MKLTAENRSTRRKTCPSATLSTTNPTMTDPGLRGERPATNRLSHGTALRFYYFSQNYIVRHVCYISGARHCTRQKTSLQQSSSTGTCQYKSSNVWGLRFIFTKACSSSTITTTIIIISSLSHTECARYRQMHSHYKQITREKLQANVRWVLWSGTGLQIAALQQITFEPSERSFEMDKRKDSMEHWNKLTQA
jgi:hypothetical protein